MTIPPLSLWQAFAIGLPLGIAGFMIQEAILRRRAAGAPPTPTSTPTPAPTPAPTGTHESSADGTPAAPAGPSSPAIDGDVYAVPPSEAPAIPWLPGLLELESDLDQAIEAVVAFVDGPPRMAGARACAEELDRLVPEDRRGAAYAAFERALGTDARPSQLQELAEALGVDLTAQLLLVRKEINPGG